MKQKIVPVSEEKKQRSDNQPGASESVLRLSDVDECNVHAVTGSIIRDEEAKKKILADITKRVADGYAVTESDMKAVETRNPRFTTASHLVGNKLGQFTIRDLAYESDIIFLQLDNDWDGLVHKLPMNRVVLADILRAVFLNEPRKALAKVHLTKRQKEVLSWRHG